MKSKLYLLLSLMILTGCNDEPSKEQRTIDNARVEVIKLNQKYNKLYQTVMSEYVRGNSNFESAAICLQELTKEIIDVNKALKIDCKQYNENGKPSMIQGEDGLSPVESIPNELKIEE